MKALILAGGYGKRLRPLTNSVPKPMIRIADKPIIEWQLEWLSRNNVDSFVILAGYLGDKLMDYISKTKFGAHTEFSIEEEPCGTAGAIRNAQHLLDSEDQFIVANGDILTNLQINNLSLQDADAVMSLVPLRSTYGVVRLEHDNITGFEEKPLIRDHWLNAGIYLLRNSTIKLMPKNGNLEQAVFPRLAEQKLLKGVKFSDAYWRSIDSFKDLEEAAADYQHQK